MSERKSMTAIKSFSVIFRVVFVLFSLIFLKEVFLKWDGYSFYMSLFDFLPHFSLSFILWTILGVMPFLVLWLIVYLLYRLVFKFLIPVRFVHIVGVLMICAVLFIIQITFFENIPVSLIQVLIGVVILLVIMRVADKYVEKIVFELNDRITPLVWIFTVVFILSIPVSLYSVLHKKPDPAQYTSAKRTFSDDKKLNIILIIADTLSALDMQLYGYNYPTTPFISEWSKDAVVFTRAYSASNWTTPSVMSLMTGQRTWTHGVWYFAYNSPVKTYENSLPYILNKKGYNNYAYVQNKHAHPDYLGLGESFNIKDHFFTFKTLFWKNKNALNRLVIFFLDRPVVRDFINLHPLFKEIEEDVKVFIRRNKILQMLSDVVSKKKFENSTAKDRLVHTVSLQDSNNVPAKNFSVDRIMNETAMTTPSELVYNQFLKNISDGKIREPYFVWLHTLPPHDPYFPPKQYRGLFGGGHSDHIHTVRRIEHYKPEMQGRVDLLRKRYDEFILYCDQQLKEFMNRLSKSIDLSNTVIIFASDHGESFSHGFQGHATVINEPVVHVPLIIKMPDSRSGRVITMPVSLIDVAPTILETAGIEVPDWMEGRSLKQLIEGESMESVPVFTTFLQRNSIFWESITKGKIGILNGNYKLVSNFETQKNVLYDLANDPLETENIFQKKLDVGERLLRLINDKIPTVQIEANQ